MICQISIGTSHAVTLDMLEDVANCLANEPGAFFMHEIHVGILNHSIPVGQFDGPYMFYPNGN